MMVMNISIAVSLFITAFTQASLPAQSSSKQVAITPFSVSSNSSTWPLNPFEDIEPSLGELIEKQCRDVPIGIGIPGFQPGIPKNDVIRMLGIPSKTSSGYWPNTRAVSYQLIPDQVSLGFLFDKASERIRQTEASFTGVVDSQLILVTLDGMLGCQLNDPIKSGLEKVQNRQSHRYSFNLGSLEGVIERDRTDRIYIGIWEADLH